MPLKPPIRQKQQQRLSIQWASSPPQIVCAQKK